MTDNGPGDNFPGSALIGQTNVGAINFGGFTVMTNLSQSKPLIGSAAEPQLDLTFSAVTSDSLAHTLFLYASDTAFTGVGPVSLTLGGTQSGGDGNTVRGRAWGGSVNTSTADPRQEGPLLADSGSSSATPFALSAVGTLTPITNPFGLSIGVQITRASAGTSTGDLNVRVAPETQSVPEPASLALLGLGLLGVATAKRRQSLQQAL